MKRKAAIIILVIVFYFSSVVPCYASLVVIEENGQLTWNVLSEEDSIALEIPRHSYIEVKRAAEVTPKSSSTVTLKKEGEKVSLVVLGEDEERELDVTNWQDDLVEIEERPEVQKLAIGIRNDKFTLNQKGIIAVTSYPVSVDSEKAQIFLSTPSGEKFISVLPLEAKDSALRTNFMNRIVDRNVDLLENENELQYSIRGEKVFNFFKMFDYSIPVTLFISASTGEVLNLEAPGWFKYLSFLFT